MRYEFVLSREDRCIAAEKGEMELEKLVKRIDSVIVTQRE